MFTRLPILILACAASVAAQRVLLVDASGKTGQYKTINAAINVFKTGDIVRVKYGAYNESITLNNKSVNIQGIGGLPIQVSGSLTITSHPSGARSRFSRLAFGQGIHTSNTAGDLLFEYCQSSTQCVLSAHNGSMSFASCAILSDDHVLTAKNIKDLFFHKTRFQNNKDNSAGWGARVWSCVHVTDSHVEFCRCSFRPANHGCWLSSCQGGSSALTLHRCTAKITGLTSDLIQGGSQHPLKTYYHGAAIRASGSTLDISGVQVRAGTGSKAAAITGGPTVRRSTNLTIPVVDPDREFAKGVLTNINLHAQPRAASLTWVALTYKIQPIPWGTSVIDLGEPFFSYVRSHDAGGRANIVMDLRQLPSTFIGIQYAMQTISLANNQLLLSSPRIGVIGL